MVLKIYQRMISIAEIILGDFDRKQAMSAAVHSLGGKHDLT